MSGADEVSERPGFQALLARLALNGVKAVLVEARPASPATSRYS